MLETAEFVSEYRDGGYVFIRPNEGPLAVERVSNDERALTVKTFSSANRAAFEEDIFDHNDFRWQPYFDLLPDDPAKTALTGLRVALATSGNEPIALLKGLKVKQPYALVTTLGNPAKLKSWHPEPSERGVNYLELRVNTNQGDHDDVYGNRDGILDIIHRGQNRRTEMLPIDWIEFLPHIDGTLDYDKRHTGVGALAIGSAAAHILQSEGLAHVWSRYVEPAHNA